MPTTQSITRLRQQPIEGREAIRAFHAEFFASTRVVCRPEQILEDGEWTALEWIDPQGLRGSGFFHVVDGKIAFQRGYWDQRSMERLHGEDPGR